jgi:hypothetical protein
VPGTCRSAPSASSGSTKSRSPVQVPYALCDLVASPSERSFATRMLLVHLVRTY